MNNKIKPMPFGWNLFQGNGAFEMYVERVIKPLLQNGKWTIEEYFKLVSKLILEEGKPQPGKKIEEYIYIPNDLPKFWNKEYNNIMTMFEELESSQTFRNLEKIKKRHYVYMPKGVAYEEQVAMVMVNWERTEYEMDYQSGIDFIDRENKKLYSVKCSKSITSNHLAKIKKYFSKIENYLKFEGYSINIIWYNTESKEVVEFGLGEIKV